MATMKTDEAVERLDAIEPHTNTVESHERAAQEALNIILLTLQPRVLDAYRRAMSRIA